jgi:hypothetical protein
MEPVLGLAGSLDLNPCDFFLWDQIVYEITVNVNTIEELAVESIRQNSDMLVRTQASIARRAQERASIAEGVISSL